MLFFLTFQLLDPSGDLKFRLHCSEIVAVKPRDLWRSGLGSGGFTCPSSFELCVSQLLSQQVRGTVTACMPRPREAAACARGWWALVPLVMLLWAGPSGGPWAGEASLGVWAARGCTTDQLGITAAPDQEPGHSAKQSDQVWRGRSFHFTEQ